MRRRIPVTIAAMVMVTLHAWTAPAHADPRLASCLSNIDYTVTDFTGGPGGVRGTITNFLCIVPTRPEISRASATVTGTARGSPGNVTIHEVQHRTWQDANGRPVETSTIELTRTMIGPAPLMVATTQGIVVEGLFAGARVEVRVLAGHATRRFDSRGGVVYENQASENDVDYG